MQRVGTPKSQTVCACGQHLQNIAAGKQAIAPLVSAPKGPQPNTIIPILTVAHTKEQTTRGFEASREPPAEKIDYLSAVLSHSPSLLSLRGSRRSSSNMSTANISKKRKVRV